MTAVVPVTTPENTLAPAARRRRTGLSRRRFTPGRGVAWLVVIAVMVATVFPFYWMVRTGLTPTADLIGDSARIFPSDPTLVNFQRVLGLTTREETIAAGGTGATIDFPRYTLNSFIFAGTVAVVQTLSCAAAAYAFARLNFRGKDAIFAVIIAGLMIPGIFTLLPNFALMRELGWLNTMLAVIAPSLLVTPFAVFFLRQFFLSLPREVEEAAMLDGVGPLGRFWRIALPMSRGPIATMILITFVGMWKEYLWPLVAGNSESARVLTVGLSVFQQQSPNTRPDWTGLMAGSTLSVIPVLLILIFLGRQLVQSLNFSGGK